MSQEKISRRFLFLDIDGVLNCPHCAQHTKGKAFQSILPDSETNCRHILAFSQLLKLIDPSAIILSSTWRLFTTPHNLAREIETASVETPHLITMDLRDKILGVTTAVHSRKRGDQIQHFLDVFRISPEEIWILDDGDDMEHLKPRLLQTTWQAGLLPELVEEWSKTRVKD